MGVARYAVSFRKALWLALEHDVLNTAKAAAYSGMLMLFPHDGCGHGAASLVPEGPTIMGQIRIAFMNFLPADTYRLLSSSMQSRRIQSAQSAFSAARI